MSLSLYDGVMLAIVIFAVFQGAMRGMAWQLAPIASLVLGYLFGVPLSAATAPWFGDPPLNHVFSLIVMYMLVSLGVYLVARSLRESIEKMKLVEFDRHLGALLGGVKGVLFTVVLTIALLSVSPTAAGFIVKSESHTIASRIVNFACPLLPQDVHKVIDPYLKPLHDHEDDERMSLAKDRTPASRDDHAVNPFEDDDGFRPQDSRPAAPRPRRNQAIYEDEPLDSPDPVREDPTDYPSRPARRRVSNENLGELETPPARRQTAIDDDDVRPVNGADDFGTDPNANHVAEEPKPRTR